MANPIVTRQLRLLFLSSVMVLFVGLGLFPILPVYAASLGASRTTIGLFFALMYAANAAGPLTLGWLTARLSRRYLFLLTSALSLPAVALAGQVTALWQLMLLTAIIWYAGGLLITLANVWTGTLATRQRRGASFGLVSLASPLGAVLGGLAVGALLEWHGYGVLFGVLAAVWAGLLVVGLGLREPQASSAPRLTGRSGPTRYGRQFGRLLGLTLLSAVAVGITQLGRSFSMQALAFPPSALASTATAGGLVAIPLTLGLGYLSDRVDRARLLAGTIALAGLAAALLAGATELWQFWLAGALSLTAQGATRGLSAALGADLLAPEHVARGLPLVNLAAATAGIVSFAATGLAMESLGSTATYLAAASLAAIAFVQVAGLRPTTGERNSGPAHPLASQPAAQTVPLGC